MARLPQTQADYAFIAVLFRRGKTIQAEAALGVERSVYVGRKALNGAGPGDLVVIRTGGRGRGEVVRRLGRADSLPVLMEGILEYFRIPRGFSRRALAEAEERALLSERKDAARRDLISLTCFTIDPDEARDFDDAISLEAGPGPGEVTLYVHIADVSYYIAAGSALDREAEKKAISVYLPLDVEPMLPPVLSNDVCSLRPGVDRKCVTVEIVFKEIRGHEIRGHHTHFDDRSGEAAEGAPEMSMVSPNFPPNFIHKVSFYRSLIRSRWRLTYNQVDDYIAEAGDGAGGLDVEAAELIERCRRLAKALRQIRHGRGALAIETFEPEFRIAEDKEVLGVRPSPESESHGLIEEFMIAANEAVAEHLERHDVPAIYRVHEEPDPEAVDALFDLMEDLGIATPPFSLKDGTPRRAGMAIRELIDSRPVPENGLKQQQDFFYQTVLRSLKQAHYQEYNLGHYGLASTAYLHFTSPIRRYPDLVAHRALLSSLGLQESDASRLALSEIALRSSENERRAAKVEHTGDDVVLAHLLDRLLFKEGWDQRFDGEIISVITSGLFVRFEGVYEGFVPARSLRGDYYVLNDKGSALVGRRSGRPFRLGDRMKVRVVRIDKLRGKVELERVR